jgi:hypothetical protein
MRNLTILLVACLLGCTPIKEKPSTQENGRKTTLPQGFVASFDTLFLSDAPLCYQDNLAFLKGIHLESLTNEERQCVRRKIKEFLTRNNADRKYAEDCYQTGVADPFAFLRLESVRILAQVGEREDIEFIRQLDKRRGINHPLYVEECERAIRELGNR